MNETPKKEEERMSGKKWRLESFYHKSNMIIPTNENKKK